MLHHIYKMIKQRLKNSFVWNTWRKFWCLSYELIIITINIALGETLLQWRISLLHFKMAKSFWPNGEINCTMQKFYTSTTRNTFARCFSMTILSSIALLLRSTVVRISKLPNSIDHENIGIKSSSTIEIISVVHDFCKKAFLFPPFSYRNNSRNSLHHV